MLHRSHYYHRIIRKLVVSFGSIFNDIRMVRYDKDGTEIERIIVPISYSEKEKFYQRITQDPELTKEVGITLPRMSFEMISLIYDPLRKTSRYQKMFGKDTNDTLNSVTATPYNFDFNLTLYVRNVEDGNQIIEQILPFFNPDMTISMNVTEMAETAVDVPLVLNSINYNSNAQGMPDDIRMLVWDLSFTFKGFLYGPISSSSLIRKVIANTYEYNTGTTGNFKLLMGSGSGDFKSGELVFDGQKPVGSNSSAFVHSWDSVSNTLIIVDTAGVIQKNHYLTGAVTNAKWNIADFAINNGQMEMLTVAPDPLSANANDAYGYTETLIQY